MVHAPDSTSTPYLPVPADKSGNLEQALATLGLPTIERHPALAYIRTLKPGGSRRTMIHSLNTIAELLGVKPIFTARRDRRYTQSKHVVYENLAWMFVPWHTLRADQTRAIKEDLAERFSVGGVNKALSALRRVLNEAWQLGLMSADDYHAAADLENLMGQPQTAGRTLTEAEVHAVLGACYHDPSAAGLRDAALIAFMWVSGARRGSAVQLEMNRYDPVTGDGMLYGAKRHTDVMFCLEGGARELMNDWLTLRGSHPGPIFQPVSQAGNIVRFDDMGAPRSMTAQAIYYILRKRAQSAGIEPFSPHDLRHSTVNPRVDLGVDMATVADWLGPESNPTTRGNTQSGERQIPYQRHPVLDMPRS